MTILMLVLWATQRLLAQLPQKRSLLISRSTFPLQARAPTMNRLLAVGVVVRLKALGKVPLCAKNTASVKLMYCASSALPIIRSRAVLLYVMLANRGCAAMRASIPDQTKSISMKVHRQCLPSSMSLALRGAVLL